MRLTLHYRGSLPSNGSPEQKHRLREKLNQQLLQFWRQPPMNEEHTFWAQSFPNVAENPYIYRRGAFHFVPLVTAKMSMVADLEIVLLRPEAPGGIITQGGDIDNRLKTLFDALTIPQMNAVPPGAAPDSDQSPYFYCLLEDDNLITSVSVKTEQLLEPCSDKTEVDLFITVKTRLIRIGIGNSHLA